MYYCCNLQRCEIRISWIFRLEKKLSFDILPMIFSEMLGIFILYKMCFTGSSLEEKHIADADRAVIHWTGHYLQK